uniref:C2H2-type domain-containing protein n=1 Tax=Gouania willdenowi TaxID=441366 RepID=A0A8C5ENW4_GOUWI
PNTLVEYAGRWKVEEEPLPLVEVYIVALLSYAQASPYLSLETENVPLVVERLSLSFLELLLSLKDFPDRLWQQFKLSVQVSFAHSKLEENGITQLTLLSTLAHYDGVWTNSILQGLLSNEKLEKFLVQEGPVLLEMRVKQLMKEGQLDKAALLAKTCSEASALQGKGSFKQTYLVCLCTTSEQTQLMDEVSEDCKEGLEMICNLESDGDEKSALSLCSAFLTRQLLQEDSYCSWELTLFWSKLMKRLEPSEQAFLDKCRQMSLLSKTVFHILFLIKVIQSEVDNVGLPVCIEMCIRALRVESDDRNMKATLCKTISCLLPNDLEVKRACQLTEFLLEPTVDSYYAVETLYNEPDQKIEEENMPITNSLRCDLLLVFKTHWPFDPEFWDWKTLKRNCLSLMGEEASIVSSIDLLNDNEGPEEDLHSPKDFGNTDYPQDGSYELNEFEDKKKKNQELKKLKEKDLISAKFRNWQAYMQYCVLCDKEFLGHRIVRHAQTHLYQGVYTCPICTQTFNSKETLIPHVTSHVKESCKERLNAMNKSLAISQIGIPFIAADGVKNHQEPHQNGVPPLQNSALVSRVEGKTEKCSTDVFEENACPVGTCKRNFKFFRNLLAHVKNHTDDEEAKSFLEMQSKKVVCQYCRRHFVSVTHLNDHLQVHCGAKPYICIQLNCNASFMSNTELLMHKKTHTMFKVRCMFPNCGKVFNKAFKLYDHEARHYKTFTCQMPDCGKVFQSQQQLDTHFAMHQERLVKEEGNYHHTVQKPKSLLEQMVCSPAIIKKEITKSIKSGASICDKAYHKPMLSSSLSKPLQSTVGKGTQSRIKVEPQKTTCPISLAPSLTSAVIQSGCSHLSDVTKHQQTLPDQLDYMRGLHPIQSQPPNKVDLGHNSQRQMFSCAVKDKAHIYTPDSLLPVTTSYVSPVLESAKPAEPTMMQLLPPTVSSHQFPGDRAENGAGSSESTGPPIEQRARYHCALETCTRHYSCYKSAAKHMKTVHPEFYEQWKDNRSKLMITYAPVLNKPSVKHLNKAPLMKSPQPNKALAHTVQRQNVIQSSFKASRALPSSAQNSGASLSIEDVINTILLSQLGSKRNSETTQSQILGSQKCQPVKDNEHIQDSLSSSQPFPSDLQGIPLANSASASIPLNPPSCSTLGTQDNGVADFVESTMDSKALVAHSLYSTHAKDLSQPGKNCSPYSAKTQSNIVQTAVLPEETKKFRNHIQPSFPTSDGANRTIGAINFQNNSTKTTVSKSPPENAKLIPKKGRTKWPGIHKDGKIFCSRCFREFHSPRSLGGHLSKRDICKPYKVTEINPELPSSFLDLLNSEKTVSPNQSQLSYNTTGVFQKSQSSVTSAPAAQKDFITFPYSQDNLPAYGNEEPSNIIQQIITHPNMSDLFNSPSPQLPFQNHCLPFSAVLPENSVIQHTENVQVKQAENLFRAHYPPASSNTFSKKDFSDPLLSKILIENPSTATQDITPINPVISRELLAAEYRSETAVQTPDPIPQSLIQTQLSDTVPSSASSGKLAPIELKNPEQNIKKRLREQILAGEFQRRNYIIESSNTNHNVAFVSSDIKCRSNDSESTRLSRDPSSKPMTPGTTDISQLQTSQSFTCFRHVAPLEQDDLSPMGILPTNPDSESYQQSSSQLQCMAEIQCAFERLDLVKESSDLTYKETLTPSTVTYAKNQAPMAKETPAVKVMTFFCEKRECAFNTLSSEALWKHLSKAHGYTLEMVNGVKRRYGLYAPFKCLKCVKSFTRNSNLRAHYFTLHKLSRKEVEDIDQQRKMAKAAEVSALQSSKMKTNKGPNASATSAVNSQEQSTKPCLVKDFKHSHPPQTSMPCLTANITSHQCQKDNPCCLQWWKWHNIRVNPKVELLKKRREKKPHPDALSPYKPYRCVHQGCLAAFTIQHNLILHYRVVHQSALSALEVKQAQDHIEEAGKEIKQEEEDMEEPEEDHPQISEFRCQVKDCCCVFLRVSGLFQHYIQVHEMLLDRVHHLLSTMRLGKFSCGHQGCTETFTKAWNYIAHVKDMHKDIKLAKPEHLIRSFKCEIAGCDRSYATKSNMLRHIMKNHQDQSKLKHQIIKEEKTKQTSKPLLHQIPKTNNGKENIESNKKFLLKSKVVKRVRTSKTSHWAKYGKPSLKTKVEALEMCTKGFPLQYPCMIKECDSVMKSERNILKHYLGHGLSEKYLEQQRSHFIFCKKVPRLRCRLIRSDDSRSDNTTDISDNEIASDPGLAEKNESSKPALRRRTIATIPVALIDTKSVILKRKRGRPRKLIEKIVKRKRITRTKKVQVFHRKKQTKSSSSATVKGDKHELSVPLGSFRPMGFEMSFLNFLQQASPSEHPLMGKVPVVNIWRSPSSLNTKDIRVRFSNKHKEASLCNVHVNLDGTFSLFSEKMLRQLQELQPTVLLSWYHNDPCGTMRL